MTIARILENRGPEIHSCGADAPVRDAVALLAEKRIGALPVMDGGIVAGIFSERDVIYNLYGDEGGILERRVGDVMTSPAVTVSPDTTVDEALSLMTRRRIRHLPVIENGRMIGFVSIGDMVKYRIDAISSEAQAMRQYIQTA